jgi:hypothetical protein
MCQGMLNEADGIIISRGNLGLDCVPEKMALVQKTLVQVNERIERSERTKERSAEDTGACDGRAGWASLGLGLLLVEEQESPSREDRSAFGGARPPPRTQP